MVPSTGGRKARGVTPALVTIAAVESAPATTRAITPSGGRSSCRIPAIADAITTARPRPTNSAILSYSPKVAIANSLNGWGTMSITNPPTARIGLAERAKISANSSAVARKTAPLITPESAAQRMNRLPLPG